MKNYFFLLIVLCFSNLLMASNQCESSFDKEVGAVTKSMRDEKDRYRWHRYAAFLEKFSDCLDGSYAEMVHDISENGLANDWKGFLSFVGKFNPSKKILINIESGFSPEMGQGTQLRKIKSNAKNACHSKIKYFCDKILKNKLE